MREGTWGEKGRAREMIRTDFFLRWPSVLAAAATAFFGAAAEVAAGVFALDMLGKEEEGRASGWMVVEGGTQPALFSFGGELNHEDGGNSESLKTGSYDRLFYPTSS